MDKNYLKIKEFLTSQKKFHISLGLERVLKILEKLNNPQNNLKIIQIAGTNGKGSTSRLLSEILTLQGYKTALFTSPHIYKYNERIKINNIDISDEELLMNLQYVEQTAQKNKIELTEFELLTVVAFLYFSKNKVDIAILETGLGGRFDATNVCDKNLFSVITSISKDHTERLGKTISKIAFEKAGIIKKSCPLIVAKNNKGLKVIQEVANNLNAPIFYPKTRIKLLFENGINYIQAGKNKYEFNLMGLYQKENLKIVLKAIDLLKQHGFKISEKSLQIALKSVVWPCRFEWQQDKNLIIDGAHNPNGTKLLRESLDFYFPNQKKIWIFGSLKNKDYKNNIKNLFQKNDEVYYFEFDKRCLTFDEFKKIYKNGKNFLENKDILKASCLKVIVGSLYMPEYIRSFL